MVVNIHHADLDADAAAERPLQTAVGARQSQLVLRAGLAVCGPVGRHQHVRVGELFQQREVTLSHTHTHAAPAAAAAAASWCSRLCDCLLTLLLIAAHYQRTPRLLSVAVPPWGRRGGGTGAASPPNLAVLLTHCGQLIF